jgi:hypothetical protein
MTQKLPATESADNPQKMTHSKGTGDKEKLTTPKPPTDRTADKRIPIW